MGIGPVDVVIIGFPGNKFTGRIAPALMDLVDSGTVRILDLLFVSKDADGVTTTIDIADLDPETGPAYLDVKSPSQRTGRARPGGRGGGRRRSRPEHVRSPHRV